MNKEEIYMRKLKRLTFLLIIITMLWTVAFLIVSKSGILPIIVFMLIGSILLGFLSLLEGKPRAYALRIFEKVKPYETKLKQSKEA